MNATQWMKTITMAAALAAAPAVALAQNTVAPSSQGNTTLQPRPPANHGYGATVSGTASGNPAAGGLPATQDDLDAWMRDHSTRNNGRITREAYMNEMQRRWDAMDANQQGLSPADVSRMTGRVDSNAQAPLTGSGVQPGNMGPGNSKGK